MLLTSLRRESDSVELCGCAQDALHSDAARREEKIELKGILKGSEAQVGLKFSLRRRFEVQRFREAGWEESQGIPNPELLLRKSSLGGCSLALLLATWQNNIIMPKLRQVPSARQLSLHF